MYQASSSMRENSAGMHELGGPRTCARGPDDGHNLARHRLAGARQQDGLARARDWVQHLRSPRAAIRSCTQVV